MEEAEKLRKENEQLKLTIRDLRQQIDNYKKQSRRQFQSDDYLV